MFWPWTVLPNFKVGSNFEDNPALSGVVEQMIYNQLGFQLDYFVILCFNC